MTDERQQRNKRKHARITRGFMIQSKPCSETEWDSLSTVRNISLGGCYFGTKRKYAAGDRLDLKLKLPGMKELMAISAEVRRCDPTDAPEHYFVAVRFLEMDDQKKGGFARLISFHTKKQSKDRQN